MNTQNLEHLEHLPPAALTSTVLSDAPGERLTSLGISQLTTSKGKGGPKLAAAPAGVVVEQPMKFLALDASCTSRVRCEQVRIGREDVVRGPAEAALSLRTPVKPLVVSAVGLGAARGLVDRLEQKVDRLGQDLREIVAALGGELGQVRAELHAAAALLNDPTAELPAARIRIQVNELLTRLAVAFLTVCKGTGYARPHAAERLLREAAFFHVWSAPGAVQAGTLRRMSSGAGDS
jgi:alkylation response protein AidB-like acyl-CoA dehydrogenase